MRRATIAGMSDHLTLRVVDGTTERLTHRATATGTAPRTLAARYVEEGLRGDEHRMIGFVDGETGRRAALRGTGLDVCEVIATVRDNGGDAVATADYLGVPAGLVEAAITYYGAFTDEIDGEIARNEEASRQGLEAWRQGQRALRR